MMTVMQGRNCLVLISFIYLCNRVKMATKRMTGRIYGLFGDEQRVLFPVCRCLLSIWSWSLYNGEAGTIIDGLFGECKSIAFFIISETESVVFYF